MSSPLSVNTTAGPILGFADTFAIRSRSAAPEIASSRNASGGLPPVLKWLGIPYARAGRWERPQPPAPWKEERRCWEFGAQFPQDTANRITRVKDKDAQEGRAARDWVPQSEEAHFVNVYAPGDLDPRKEKLPVMVWVYGGAFEYGSSDEILYDGTALVRRSWQERGERFLLVSGNYRTNVFGFFSGRDVAETDPEGLSGNYGIYDVQAIFEWVRVNIARFGGDADNVTAFGESAGAIAISQLFCSGKRLFNKAILQSGGPMTKDTRTLETAYRPYAEVIEKFASGAKTAAERMQALRAVPAADLLAAHIATGGSQPTSLTLEPPGSSGFLSESVQLRLMRGEWDPWIEGVIVGTCEDEGALFVFADENVNSSLGISKLLKRYPGMVAARARALYPDNKGDKYDLTKAPLAQFTADWTFNVPVFELAKTMAGKQNTKTGHPCKLWMYRYRQPIRKLMFNGKSKFNFGVTHAMDLPVTFDVEQLWEEGDGAAGTAPVMNAMWAAFASKGTPGSDWTPFSPDAPSWLVFSPGGKVHNERVEAFYSERTRFLSELLIRREQLAADSGLVKTEKRGSVL